LELDWHDATHLFAHDWMEHRESEVPAMLRAIAAGEASIHDGCIYYACEKSPGYDS
jgi:hypothetical protein